MANSICIRTDAVDGKDVGMKGNTCVHYGDLYFTGKIKSGLFGIDGHWTQQKVLMIIL